MFEILTQKKRIQNAEAENKKLALRNMELEEALLELAALVAKEMQDGKNISTEN